MRRKIDEYFKHQIFNQKLFKIINDFLIFKIKSKLKKSFEIKNLLNLLDQ